MEKWEETEGGEDERRARSDKEKKAEVCLSGKIKARRKTSARMQERKSVMKSEGEIKFAVQLHLHVTCVTSRGAREEHSVGRVKIRKLQVRGSLQFVEEDKLKMERMQEEEEGREHQVELIYKW